MASLSQSGVSSLPAQHDLCCILIFGHPSNGKRVATSSDWLQPALLVGRVSTDNPQMRATVMEIGPSGVRRYFTVTVTVTGFVLAHPTLQIVSSGRRAVASEVST